MNKNTPTFYLKPKALIALIIASLIIIMTTNIKPAQADGGDFIAGAIATGVVVLIGNELSKQNANKTRKVKKVYRQSPAARAEPRMSRTQKRVIQNKLNELGYNVGRADGSFGKNTRRGIKRYQASINASMTGYLTLYQYEELTRYVPPVQITPTYQVIATPAPVAVVATPPSQSRFSAQDIVTLQQTLGALGYDVGPVTGQMNPKTQAGITSFTAARDFLPDNIKQTDNYKSAYSLTNSQNANSTQPTPAAQPQPAPAQLSNQDPLIGGWVEQNQSCSILSTYGNEQLLKITANEYNGYEYECQRTSTLRNGDTLTLNMTCTAEGSPLEPETNVVTLLNANSITFGPGTHVYKKCY